MATDARLLEAFYPIVENIELMIQLAQEIHDPGLINQETAELHEMFAVYRTALVQMINQGGEMVSLLWGVKLETPRSFTGVINIDTVNAFIFQVEQYLALTNMVDKNYCSRFASMLLTNNAAVWLQSWNLDWELIVWEDLK